MLRCYVAAVPVAALVLTCFAATRTTWRVADVATFALLLGCGLASVAATPRVVYRQGGMTRDFITAWVLPIAILLPPFYAMVAPIPLYVLTQFWVFR
ncbi:MAG: GGDEF domain-containing protein, partial [Actinomycetes bacterium]